VLAVNCNTSVQQDQQDALFAFSVLRLIASKCIKATNFNKLKASSALTCIKDKLNNYLKITGILNNVFRPQKTVKKTRIKLYNTLTLPVLLYGSDIWTVKGRDASRISAAEMKCMTGKTGYTWTDYKTNTQIAKELKITPILDKLLEYKRNWIQHVNRMLRNRLPRVMKNYSPTGRRNCGKTLRRLLDTRDRNGSTSGPTP
jgi:hypothetical protein